MPAGRGRCQLDGPSAAVDEPGGIADTGAATRSAIDGRGTVGSNAGPIAAPAAARSNAVVTGCAAAARQLRDGGEVCRIGRGVERVAEHAQPLAGRPRRPLSTSASSGRIGERSFAVRRSVTPVQSCASTKAPCRGPARAGRSRSTSCIAVALIVRVAGGARVTTSSSGRAAGSRARTRRCAGARRELRTGARAARRRRRSAAGSAPALPPAAAAAHARAADEKRLRSSARSGCSIASATGPLAVSTSRSAGPRIASRRDGSAGTRRCHSDRDASSPALSRRSRSATSS